MSQRLSFIKLFFSRSLIFSNKVLWIGFIIIAVFVLFSANYQQKSLLAWQISSQKSYCQEQQQNRLQRFSQFNDELMNYAIAARNSPSLTTTREYLAHRNILRFILFSGTRSYSIKKHWYRQNILDTQSLDQLHIKDLMSWLKQQIYSFDIKQPMYFLDSPFKNLLVVVPLSLPPTSQSMNNAYKEVAIFEIEKEALAIAMGESTACQYGMWNHRGQALFENHFTNFPLLLSFHNSQKGEIWVNGRLGKDLILFEQHPSSILIAHKMSLQSLYQEQSRYFKSALFYLGVLCLLWCLILLSLSSSISRPLQKFQQSLVQISKGEFQSIPRLFLKGELGKMEKTIVQISETLQKNRDTKT